MIPDTQEWGGKTFSLVEIFMHGNTPESQRQQKSKMMQDKKELEEQDIATHYIYHKQSSTYGLYKETV